MIDVVRMRARAEARRRWGSLLLLAVLIGVAGAVTLTAFAGARRTDSSPARFMRADETNDLFVDYPTPLTTEGVRELAALPQLSRSSVYAAFAAFPVGQYMPAFAPISSEQDDALGRGLLIEGRRPAPHAGDEIALSESHARALHAKVGDRIPFTYLDHRELERCYSDEPDPVCDKIFQTPRINIRVVGIIRTGNDVNTGRHDDPANTTSWFGRGFFEAHKDDIGWQVLIAGQLKPSATPESYVAAARKVRVPNAADLRVEPLNANATFDAVDVLTTGLLLFGVVALLAGAFAIGQAVVRHVAASTTDRETLQSLGAGRTLVLADAAAPVFAAATVGTVLAVLGAYLASSLMPIGLARRIEPHGGLDADLTVFAFGALAILALVLGCALVTAWPRRADRVTRRAAVGSAVARVAETSSVPPVSVGLWHAFSPGRGDRAVPVRSTLLAVVAAVAGVVAVLGFSAGLSHLVDTPGLYGWSYDAVGFNDASADQVRADPDVAAVAEVWAQSEVRVNGRPTFGAAFRPIAGDIKPVVSAGRAPALPGEVALGADTLAAAKLHIGDTVEVEGNKGKVTMRVVGRGVFPQVDDTRPLADGAYLHADDVERVGLVDAVHTLAVRLRPGADRDAFSKRITEVNNGEEPQFAVPPAEIDKLEQVESLPRVLAAFLAVLGAIAVAHSLVVSVRRRATDFAVLRALGFRPRDVKASVSWQAASVAIVGALVGLPLGVLIGRFAWSRISTNIGVIEAQRVPGLVLLLAMPIAVGLSIAIALLPARRAARVHPADALRSE